MNLILLASCGVWIYMVAAGPFLMTDFPLRVYFLVSERQ